MAGFFDECYKCTERYVGCRSICPHYKTAREKYEARNELVKKNKKDERDFNLFLAESKIRTLQRKHRLKA